MFGVFGVLVRTDCVYYLLYTDPLQLTNYTLHCTELHYRATHALHLRGKGGEGGVTELWQALVMI